MLTLLIFLPLAGVLALLLVRRDDHAWIRRVALAIALVEFALSLLLLRGFAAGIDGLSIRGIARLDSRRRRFTTTSASTASACFWCC